MTHINPSPSQIPETKIPNPQIHLSCIFKHWILFLIEGLFNISIITFDLGSDWLLLHVIQSLWIYKHVQSGKDASFVHLFFAHLPVILMAFVVIATIVYSLQVIHFFIRFWLNRSRYRSKVDGIPPEVSTCEKCINDLVITGPIILHNLPILVIIFLLQFFISCDFFFYIDEKPVIILSISSTCISVLWRFAVTSWNWGCFGQRYSYHSGLEVRVIRIINVILLCIAFCFIVLNFSMVMPVDNVDDENKNELINKHVIDRWTDLDYVVFTIATDVYYPDEDSSKNLESLMYNLNDTSYANYYKVVRLRDIISHGTAKSRIRLDDNQTEWMQTFALLSNTTGHFESGNVLSNCTVIFSFNDNLQGNEIQYNIGYMCESINDKECTPRSMHTSMQHDLYNESSHVSARHDISDTNSVAMASIMHNVTNTGSVAMPTMIMIIRPHVALSWQLIGKETPCGVHLILNSTLPLSHNVC